ncbi:ergothioneine biosynthesis glutamate--cysteine ligase EgtA [Geodermatophilus sp. URMC 63]
MPPAVEERTALDLDTALATVADVALRPGPLGRVGLELEAHLLDLDRPAARVPWGRVTAALAALPPLPGGSRVTVEPGGQVELSGPPAPGAGAAVAALRADRAVLAAALAGARLGLAPVGADPLRPPARVCPAPRYRAMEQHFAAVGCGGPGTAMMTATASLQVNLDAGPPAGWSRRVALAHQLGPVLVAVSACSPLADGRATGWRSSRQQVWGALDQARCGPLLGGADPAGEWAAYALAAPVMMVRDPDTGDAQPVLGRTPFADWVTGAVPLAGRRPTAADLDYHLSTLFPPVRPRGYLEIRYLDAAPEPWWPALAAVTAALLDDPAAADTAADVTAPVAGAWTRAARDGLADPQLCTAARHCLAAALPAVDPSLRDDVTALTELAERGRSPGDALSDAARAGGPAAALAAATETTATETAATETAADKTAVTETPEVHP